MCMMGFGRMGLPIFFCNHCRAKVIYFSMLKHWPSINYMCFILLCVAVSVFGSIFFFRNIFNNHFAECIHSEIMERHQAAAAAFVHIYIYVRFLFTINTHIHTPYLLRMRIRNKQLNDYTGQHRHYFIYKPLECIGKGRGHCMGSASWMCAFLVANHKVDVALPFERSHECCRWR